MMHRSDDLQKSRAGTKRISPVTRPLRFWPLLGLSLVLLVLAMMGCSSDESSLVGTQLVTTTIDTMLDTLGVNQISQYIGKNIVDEDVPLVSQELLYLGSQGGSS